MPNIPVNIVDHVDKVINPGDILYAYNSNGEIAGMEFMCPCGCGEKGYIPFKGKNTSNHPIWQWDGNVNKPTLTPSLQRTINCRWHGYVTNGEWVSC